MAAGVKTLTAIIFSSNTLSHNLGMVAQILVQSLGCGKFENEIILDCHIRLTELNWLTLMLLGLKNTKPAQRKLDILCDNVTDAVHHAIIHTSSFFKRNAVHLCNVCYQSTFIHFQRSALARHRQALPQHGIRHTYHLSISYFEHAK